MMVPNADKIRRASPVFAINKMVLMHFLHIGGGYLKI
jgi:hypothetical protein